MIILRYAILVAVTWIMAVSGASAVEPDAIAGNWVDAKCRKYEARVTGKKVRFTRTLSTGRTREYAGTFKNSGFEVTYKPTAFDIRNTPQGSRLNPKQVKMLLRRLKMKAMIKPVSKPGQPLRLELIPKPAEYKIASFGITYFEYVELPPRNLQRAWPRIEVDIEAKDVKSKKPIKKQRAGRKVDLEFTLWNRSRCVKLRKVSLDLTIEFKPHRRKIRSTDLKMRRLPWAKNNCRIKSAATAKKVGMVKLVCKIPPLDKKSKKSFNIQVTAQRRGQLHAFLSAALKNFDPRSTRWKLKTTEIYDESPVLQVRLAKGGPPVTSVVQSKSYRFELRFEKREFAPFKWLESNKGLVRVVSGARRVTLPLVKKENGRLWVPAKPIRFLFSGKRPSGSRSEFGIMTKHRGRVTFAYKSKSGRTDESLQIVTIARKFKLVVAGWINRYRSFQHKGVLPARYFTYVISVTNKGLATAPPFFFTANVTKKALKSVTAETISRACKPVGPRGGHKFECAFSRRLKKDQVATFRFKLKGSPGPGQSSNLKSKIVLNLKFNPGGETKILPIQVISTSEYDVYIVKSKTYRSAEPGTGIVRYRIEIANRGPQDARAVKIVVPVSQNEGPVLSSSKGCRRTANQVSCIVRTIKAKDTITIEFRRRYTPGPIGETFVKVTSLDARLIDSKPDNNNHRFEAIKPSTKFADVAWVEKRSYRTKKSGSVEYRLAIRNNGPAIAKGVVIRVRAPTRGRLQRGGHDGLCEIKKGIIECRLAKMAKRKTLKLSLSYVSPVNQNRLARVSVEGPGVVDKVGRNNSINLRLIDPGKHHADLIWVAGQSRMTPIAGQRSVRYELTVKNKGPAEARTVIILASVPRGARVNHQQTTGGSCIILKKSNRLKCRINRIASGDTVVVKVEIKYRGNLPASAKASVAVTGEGLSDPYDNNKTTLRLAR